MSTAQDVALDRVLAGMRQLVQQAKRLKQERAEQVHPQLHGAAWVLLVRLVETGPVRPCRLAELMGLPPSVVTRQADELAALGLLERRPDPDDGRARLLTATELARSRLGDDPRPYRAVLRDRVADWDPDDLAQLARLLERLVTSTGPQVDVASPARACSPATAQVG